MKLLNTARRFVSIFQSEWNRLTPPSPKGEKIVSSSILEKIQNPVPIIHVTQYNRIEAQLPTKEMENRGRLFFSLGLHPGKPYSPLIFGGENQPGCWTAEDPVIVRFACNNLLSIRTNVFGHTFFTEDRSEPVKILDIWRCNKEWIRAMRENREFVYNPVERFKKAMNKSIAGN